jgi:putative Mn2+ efflux pump MntP
MNALITTLISLFLVILSFVTGWCIGKEFDSISAEQRAIITCFALMLVGLMVLIRVIKRQPRCR